MQTTPTSGQTTRLFERAVGVAVADASVDRESFDIWECPIVVGRPWRSGVYYSPSTVVAITEALLGYDEWEESNRRRDRHRIAILNEPDLPHHLRFGIVVLRVRHELRHVEHWNEEPELLRLQDVANESLLPPMEPWKFSPVALWQTRLRTQ